MKFRNDICSLRAFAVIPVLFFHAGIEVFEGGFLGVDVFFIISGYLITTNIYNSINSGRFNFFDFYDKRFRRIIPALYVVLLATTIISPIFMLPYELKNFGQSLVATTLSANNILLYLTSGYWSLAAEFKPLYHTWSLAIEEQYYFIIPIIILVISIISSGKRMLLVTLIGLIIISMYLSIGTDNKELNFLFIGTRAWELLAGSILSITLINKTYRSNLLNILGLSIILYSYFNPFLISNALPWVGFLPVIGTIIFITFQPYETTTYYRILTNKHIYGLGLISYSIYLWHQPLLSYLRLSSITEPNSSIMMFVAMLSIPIAYLSWKYIETPFRSKETFSNRRFYSLLIFTSAIFSSVGVYFHLSYEQFDVDNSKYTDSVRKLKKESFTSNIADSKVLVIGNSFARDFVNMLRENREFSRTELIYIEGGCELFNREKLHNYLNADVVYWSENWGQVKGSHDQLEYYKQCYDMLDKTLKLNAYIVGSKNFGWNNNFLMTRKDVDRVYPLEHLVHFNKIANDEFGDRYIDILGMVKDSRGKVPVILPHKDKSAYNLISYDTNHLTKEGARYIGGFLVKDERISNYVKAPFEYIH